ncbi:ribonuclease HII [Candidatus Peregrinibacteria bacterium CG10_big_fil_rev_8_21_14_0_10_36_19]|nr:MAG: ribonuclease HII [Candidatus Peregrinibacteria bacterium CG10_big_fil_rev_8_21_14_0_10_36_19]
MSKFIPIESELRKSGLFFVAGIDEAGRGPLAGPLVCAAVILKPNARLPKLDDSKKLSKKTRETLFTKIIENSLDYAITIVSHSTIDDINIVNAVKFGNQQCVKRLTIKPDMVLIDGRDKQIIDIPFQTIIKGDQKVKTIAAASVLAKVTRDRIMERYHEEFPQYNFNKHMGYGTKDHRSNIRKHGVTEIHRTSYTLL